MKESGRTRANAQINTNIVQQHSAQQSTKLDDDTFTLLVSKYKEMYPEFDNIHKEYIAYVNRLKTAKNKMLVALDFDNWVPDFLRTHCDIKSFQYPVNLIKTQPNNY